MMLVTHESDSLKFVSKNVTMDTWVEPEVKRNRTNELLKMGYFWSKTLLLSLESFTFVDEMSFTVREGRRSFHGN